MFFQSLHVTKVSHPTVNILQVKDLEDRILTHLGIQGIDDATLFDDGIPDILTFPKDGLCTEAYPRCLNLIFFQ